MARGPFRNLVVTTPLTRGEDVLALQRAINRLSARSKYALPRVGQDGRFGLDTLGRYKEYGARGAGYYLGAADKQISRGEPCRKHLQTIIRAPWRRYPAEFARGGVRYRRRRRELARLRGPTAALTWAHKQIGVHEQPYGSNRGPEVSAYQRKFGFNGQAWCGAFVGCALIAGGLHPNSRIAWVPNLRDDYRRVAWADRQPGDIIALFNYGHMGILDFDSNHTIEGNTSPSNRGSQANGGGVYRRLRDRNEVAGVFRPRWA